MKKPKTKLSAEQIAHYLKGGKFRAIYKPTKLDISSNSKMQIGKELIIYQNMMVVPIVISTPYLNQHAFDTSEIYGWSPEEDFEILEMLDDYIPNPQMLPHYMYKLHYTRKEQLKPNFGKGSWKAPMMIGRDYAVVMDNYVLGLSNPQATKIEKAVYTGETEDVEWKVIYHEHVQTTKKQLV